MDTIKISVEVKLEDLESVLDSASRGSDYWAEGADELAYESTVRGVLYEGKSISLKDAEDDGKKYTLTRAKVLKGLEVLAKVEPSMFADILMENADNNTGDALLQCALFGEVRYS